MADHTLDNRRRQREERTSENLMADSAERMSALTASVMEIQQKHVNLWATTLNYFADTLNGIQGSIGHMVQQTQKLRQDSERDRERDYEDRDRDTSERDRNRPSAG